nr:immunoglobulin light chain junction region [Macaca mulatta]
LTITGTWHGSASLIF